MERYQENRDKMWKPSFEDDPVSVDVENTMHIAAEIDTRPADIESRESYEERIGDYKANGFTYIPMPNDLIYYNTEEGWVKDMNINQFISEDTHLTDVLELLQQEPFLMVYPRIRFPVLKFEDRTVVPNHGTSGLPEYESMEEVENFDLSEDVDPLESANSRPGDLIEQFPEAEETIRSVTEKEVSNANEEYVGIITLSDVNRRGVKKMIYVVLSGLVSALSYKIEEEYPNSESIFKHLRAETIGRWHKDRMEGLEIHVAEHMNLLDLMQVIQASDSDFVNSCGFESKSAVQDLNSINDVRNKVMHANKSLIYDRRDIQDIVEVIDRAQEIVEQME